MTIQAIDTLYRNCYFRSRLEARYAVFFDILKIAWRYEPEAYRVGPDRLPYLPDFYLPNLGTWVEVKGTEEDFTTKADVYSAAVDPESGLPGIADSVLTTRGFLILGPIRDIKPDSRRPFHTLIQHGRFWDNTAKRYVAGAWRAWAAFAEDSRIVLNAIDCEGSTPAGLPPAKELAYTATVRVPGLPFGPNKVAAAYAIARAARFDQGKKGFAESVFAAVDQFKDDREYSTSEPDTDKVWTRSEDSVMELPGRRRSGPGFDQWGRRITADGQLVSQTPEHIAGMAKAMAELDAMRAKATS